MNKVMEDPADYLASKYKYLIRVPGSRYSILLILSTAAIIGLFAGQLSGKPASSMLYSMAGFSAVPLTLAVLSKKIFRGAPLHSNFRRTCQLTLLSNYILVAVLIVSYIYELIGSRIFAPAVSATLASIVFIRLTLTSAIDGEKGLRIVSWSALEPISAAFFISIATGLPVPNVVLAAPFVGAAPASFVLLYLSRPDRDGISSLRLARGFTSLMLEGNPAQLEETLKVLGSMERRVTDAFIFKGKTSGRLSAIIILPFHMGPFRRMGSSLLNWLIESKAESKGMRIVALKGCTTHRSDMISSNDAARVADEVVSHVSNIGDGWGAEAALFGEERFGEARAIALELSGRRLAFVSLHPSPMEDIPEETADFAGEYNVSVIDTHNSFSPDFKRLTPKNLEDIQNLLRSIGGLGEGLRGPLKFSISRAGFGGFDPKREVGPCGYSLLAFEVCGKSIALAVIDGNNAHPWVAEALKDGLRRLGWHQAEVLTTDTHSINGVVLGGRGYYPVGEHTSREELLHIFERLSREAASSLEETEASFTRIRHSEVRLFTAETLERLANRVRKHVTIYLAHMVAATVLAYLAALLI
ncbi:MAG: DUF2070 family protein [Nitrososphaerota archaeon]